MGAAALTAFIACLLGGLVFWLIGRIPGDNAWLAFTLGLFIALEVFALGPHLHLG